ncbi:hypothetical protein BKA69DRAFT_1099991 [Paraphysoderma sedebokerense]|nr:hypothetical protein BKA69DRAFT_1099991 [Paraphysoderma sedebokerense]
MKWTATLHRITSVNGRRKYIRKGLISDTRNSLQRLHKYHVKFLPPPTIGQPGEYLIVLAIEMWTYWGRYKPVMIVSKPVILQSTTYPRSTLGSLESNALIHRSGLVNEIPTEIVNSILNEMANPGDVCAFCSQSKVVRIQCDEILSRFHFSPNSKHQEAAPSAVQQNVKYSTSEICKIASVEQLLQRLELKYEESELTRILNDKIRSETTIQTFKSTIINGHGNIPASFSLWAALIYQGSFTDPFVKRYIDIRGRMDRFFDFGRKWPTLDSTTTIDNLKSTLEGVLEHPKSEKVKSNLAKQLTVLVGDTHILFNFHPL